MNDFERRIKVSMEASISSQQKLLESGVLVSALAEVISLTVTALRRGNKIILCGNGGSAGDAQHIAAEFVGRFAFNRPALPALALSVNTSCLTAIGNDYGFEQVFARQIEALGKKGDVAIGISTSGNSVNVIHAMLTAGKLGLNTIGLTGAKGGELKNAVDLCLCAPSCETPRIQESHILIGHILSELVEQTMFDEKHIVPAT